MPFAESESYDGLGLAELVANDDVKPEELLDAAIERADARNPVLNAIPYRWDDEARASIAGGLPEGPFRGVPFLLKDLGTPYAGQPMSSGSGLFAEFVADHDSELVSRWTAAGLVIFGRTTSPEFGLTSTTESRLHGETHNPWDLERTPGGSSGGSAAAVAAGVLPIASASDGGGSIRIPASCCGLFGMKPTRGRNPSGPDVGEGWAGMSTAHAVSRSVRDSAALLDATAGPDVGAPYWAQPPARPFLEEVGVDPGKLRIGYVLEAFNGSEVDPACLAAVADAAELCAGLGHDVEPVAVELDRESWGRASALIVTTSTRVTVEDRAKDLGREATPDDVERWTWRSATTEEATAGDYARAVRDVHAVGRQVNRYFEEYDVLLSPTMAVPPLELGRLSLDREDQAAFRDDIVRTIGFTSLFNASGNPAMSVPLFWNEEGLPIGLQFAGRYSDEATLFRLAGQLESARPWAERRPSV
ncbi:MAG: amidase [Chloroflexi bacterium]|nr:amidase [Chloroflexota bacterium]